jgi:hypothetical protein
MKLDALEEFKALKATWTEKEDDNKKKQAAIVEMYEGKLTK